MSTARSSLQTAIISQQRITVVVGNANTDADSIASAIIYAYLKSCSLNTPLTNTSVNRHQPTYQYPLFHVPLVNQHRQSIRDRHDLSALLQHGNLQIDHLITLDDLEVEPPAGLNPNNTSKLRPQLTRLIVIGSAQSVSGLSPDFDASVVGYIGHRPSRDLGSSSKSADPHIVGSASSCTSIIVNHCRALWDNWSILASSSIIGSWDDDMLVRKTWDAQIAKLALAAILESTENLKDDRSTMEHDIDACRYLEAKILLREPSWERDRFYQEMTQGFQDG